MRNSAFMFLYAFGLGWYVRASGLDEDIARAFKDGYDLAVLHTAATVRGERPAAVTAQDREAVA